MRGLMDRLRERLAGRQEERGAPETVCQHRERKEITGFGARGRRWRCESCGAEGEGSA